MRLRDIVCDPDFAGLHWSIPPSTPLDVREMMHVGAALAARRTRNQARHVFHPVTLECLHCRRSACAVHADRLECHPMEPSHHG